MKFTQLCDLWSGPCIEYGSNAGSSDQVAVNNDARSNGRRPVVRQQIHELLLSVAAGHQQNIELRRLGDRHFGRQNQPLNIADREARFRDHMDG